MFPSFFNVSRRTTPSFGEMSMAICRVPWGDTSQRFVNWFWCLFSPKKFVLVGNLRNHHGNRISLKHLQFRFVELVLWCFTDSTIVNHHHSPFWEIWKSFPSRRGRLNWSIDQRPAANEQLTFFGDDGFMWPESKLWIGALRLTIKIKIESMCFWIFG